MEHDTAVRHRGEQEFRELLECVAECPRDVDLLIRTGNRALELGRPSEAFLYLSKAFELEPSHRFLLPKLRQCASAEDAAKVERLARRPAAIGAIVSDAFRYPFRGSGLGILIVGSIFFFAIRIVTSINLFPVVAMFVGVLIAGYVSAWWMDIARRSAVWEDEPPPWPDPSMWTELLADWSKIVSAQLAAFLPLLGMGAYLFASGAMETPPTRWDEGFLLAVGAYVLFFGVLGLAYLPMALMANALLGTSLAAWNPVFIVRSIVKIPREYFVCVAVVAGLTIASAVAELAISGAGLFLGGGIAVTFVELFTMGVQMRMFGLLYGWRQARLRWFE